MKRHFRFYFFSILVILFGCAPKNLPPPLYSGIELTLNEVISRSGDGIDSVKAVLDIDIEKEEGPFYHGNASILIKKPRIVHIKTYNLGMLTADVVVKDNDLYVLHGRINRGLEPFIKGLYDTVFWWDSVKDGYMYRDNGLYIIRKDGRELSLDSATLFPVKQSVMIEGKTFHITYNIPHKKDDFWYPSSIEIMMDDYRFSVRIERLFINPQLGEDEFMPLQTSSRVILQQTQ